MLLAAREGDLRAEPFPPARITVHETDGRVISIDLKKDSDMSRELIAGAALLGAFVGDNEERCWTLRKSKSRHADIRRC